MDTLKKIYENHQKVQIAEKANRKAAVLLEAQRIYENKEIRILLEELDDSKLDKLSSTLQKLVQLIGPIRNEVGTLANAVDKAHKDLESQMSGGAKEWIKSKLGMAAAAKAMALVGALKQGFSQMPKIAKFLTASGGQVDKTKTLNDLLQPNSLKNAQNILKKSLTPPGFLASLKNIMGSSLPYVDNIDVLVQELLTLPYEKLERFSSDMSQVSLPVSSQDAKQVVDSAAQGTDAPAAAGDAPQQSGAENQAGGPDSGATAPAASTNVSSKSNTGESGGGLKPITGDELGLAFKKNVGKLKELIGGTELRGASIQKISATIADIMMRSFPNHFKD